ncbi:unnamed protein product [Sphagnum troendelagicum]|uniref:RING-type domain-containing protein n=1 Tax=Sphagnum troendelagicum TaxID=128251 RepID=A0ABP0U538_9BRYO
MGSGSSRSASDQRAALRRERDAATTTVVMVAAAHSVDRRPSFRRNPERLSVEEIMRPGRRDHLNWCSVGSHGEVNPWEAEGSTSRELGSSEPQPSVNLVVGGGGNNSQSAPSCHVHWDRPSLPSGGEGNIHHLESEASSSSSQPGVLRGQGVYLQRARMNSSSGIHDEEAGGSRQPLHDERLHYTCETTQQRHRVNEMQERLRSYAGLPSSVDLDQGSFMLSDSSDSYHRMELVSGSANQGLFSSASDDRDADSTSAWPAPSLLQSWGQSNVWEGSFLRGQSSAGPVSVRSSTSVGQNSGLSASETRRSSGRRLWDALSRGTFHRRTSPQTMAALADLEENSIVSGDVEQIVDAEALHGSRSLDLEERRRRVRSQVWALRRLSNGLDGTSFHSRLCAGSHNGHHCSCEAHNIGDDLVTRASISRIIMLAEALFEVLDEIHRQSVALSRSATVSLASQPAPLNVVNAIPLHAHCKPFHDSDEEAQCYICLVEYEEGDAIRTLPCKHEYHKDCVDKWLTEVHGVCPLCRGNVCEPKAVPVED